MTVIRFPPIDLRKPMATRLNWFQLQWRRWFGKRRANVARLRMSRARRYG